MVSQKAYELMLDFEGLDQPGLWPGGGSGVTIGHGYDLGYSTPAQFRADWSPFLSAEALARLTRAIGLRGARAQAMARDFRDIKVTAAAADQVFVGVTIPQWEALTKKAFPGCELLPADAFGALVSLCYNRGTDMAGPRRQEMAWIREEIAQWATAGLKGAAPSSPANPADLPQLLDDVANFVVAMKRLWIGQGEDGLLRRRDAEAGLIRGAVAVGDPSAV